MGFRVKSPPKMEGKGKEKGKEKGNSDEKRVEFQEISIDEGIWYPIIASWSGGSKGHTEIQIIE